MAFFNRTVIETERLSLRRGETLVLLSDGAGGEGSLHRGWLDYHLRYGSVPLHQRCCEGQVPRRCHSCRLHARAFKIEIIDAYGTFEQDEEPSYDIFVQGNPGCLYKHIRQSWVLEVVE